MAESLRARRGHEILVAHVRPDTKCGYRSINAQQDPQGCQVQFHAIKVGQHRLAKLPLDPSELPTLGKTCLGRSLNHE